uniref:Uncharacterized protein n=1 Tax=Knipowitschia caucasica TaxID=637954 RepID=A0AAV2JTW4_KNICA
MGYYDEDENPRICFSDTGCRRLNISTNMRRHSFPLEARKAANVIYVSGPAVQPRSWFSLARVIIRLLLAGFVVSWLAMAMATDGEVQQLQHQVKHLHQLKEEVDHLRDREAVVVLRSFEVVVVLRSFEVVVVLRSFEVVVVLRSFDVVEVLRSFEVVEVQRLLELASSLSMAACAAQAEVSGQKKGKLKLPSTAQPLGPHSPIHMD